jgi:hypothetical protein
MRIAFALPVLLLVSACNVSKDEGNDTTTLSFNEAEAAATVDAVGNDAKEAGGAILNDVKATSEKVADKVGNVDVDVNVDTHEDHKTDGNKN